MARKVGWSDETIGVPGGVTEPDPKTGKTKRKTGRPKKTAKVCGPANSYQDGPPWDDPAKLVEDVASQIGVDLSRACPVCRSLECCDCTEQDRSYIRRIRFTADVEGVARCEKCRAPLSTIHVLARPKGGPPYGLEQFDAIYGCARCSGAGLATMVLYESNGARPLP